MPTSVRRCLFKLKIKTKTRNALLSTMPVVSHHIRPGTARISDQAETRSDRSSARGMTTRMPVQEKEEGVSAAA